MCQLVFLSGLTYPRPPQELQEENEQLARNAALPPKKQAVQDSLTA